MRILTRVGAYEVFSAQLCSNNRVVFNGVWGGVEVTVNEKESYTLIEEIYESGYCDLTSYRITDSWDADTWN